MIPLFKVPEVNLKLSGNILHGHEVEKFEDAYQSFTGAPYCVAVSSCTMAITLTMRYYSDRIDHIKVPSMVPPVVCNAIIDAGEKFEFVDNYNWMGRFYHLVNQDNLCIVDYAHMATNFNWMLCPNKTTHVGLNSFYPTKPIGGMDGGMISTDDKDFSDWLRIAIINGSEYDTHSWNRKCVFPGWKVYMNRAQAIVANESMRLFDGKKEKLHHVWHKYNAMIDLDHSRLSTHLFYVILSQGDGTRQELMNKLKLNDIYSGVHYQSLKGTEPYDKYDIGDNDCEKSFDVSNRILSLPFHEDLTKKDIEKICNIINEHVS